jgi:hypothetical protein
MGTLLVVSDIHRAGLAEQARRGFDARVVGNPFLRTFQRLYRRHVWMADPMSHNDKLEEILRRVPGPDRVVANGDFTLDTGFVGVSDDAAMESAAEALDLLRQAYGDRVRAVMGDHEIGKKSFMGGAGGVRRASLERAETGLGIPRLWRETVGEWLWIGMTSTLAAWPVFRAETPEEEHAWWEVNHAEHLSGIDAFFRESGSRRILLFCHDPTALPFLSRLPGVRQALPRLEATVIGHLHTPLVLGVGRALAGMPRVEFAGYTVRRISAALREARCWKGFRVVLCPSPPGIQLLKDGGYLTADWPPESGRMDFRRHRVPW